MEGTSPSADTGADANQQSGVDLRQIAEKSKASVDAASQPKRGRGRPPGSKTRNPSPSGQSGVSNSGNRYQVDTALIKKVVGTALNSIDRIVTNRTKAIGVMLKTESEDLKALIETVRMTDEEKEIMAELSAVLAEKYDILGQYAPEFIFCVTAGGYTWRVWSTQAKLNQLVKLREKLIREAANRAQTSKEES